MVDRLADACALARLDARRAHARGRLAPERATRLAFVSPARRQRLIGKRGVARAAR
jgi:hypothetical protein